MSDSALIVQDREHPQFFRAVMVVRRGFFPWPTINLSRKAFDFARNFFDSAAGKVGAVPVSAPTAEGAAVVVDMRPSITQSVVEFKRRVVRGFNDWDLTADNVDVFRITTGDLDVKRAPEARMVLAEEAEAAAAETRFTGRIVRVLKVGRNAARFILVGAFVLAALVVLLPLLRPKVFNKLLGKIPTLRT